MTKDEIIEWMLQGDVSIQYQVTRYLLKTEKIALKNRIETEGWGAKLMSLQKPDGHWGMGFYQPKWTSTHYTLLELKNLNISNRNENIRATINLLLKNHKDTDGGINPAKTVSKSDVCICGMFLDYASYFGANEEDLKSIVDFILSQQLKDGGFNCQLNRKGAVHSSLHTTISVLEGFLEYTKNHYHYKLPEIKKAENDAREFILEHKLYQSHRTGHTISESFLKLSYPCRWRYDILRALDYFQNANTGFDKRMTDALEILLKKRRPDNTWPLQAKHTGQTHFDMEQAGKPSRWNTLRAMRVLNHFRYED